MGEYKGTKNNNEPGDIEVLYFYPSWHNDNVISQSVAIAPLENNETSIIMSKVYRGGFPGQFIHLVFTEEETDMLIDGLIKAKKRWKELDD